MLTELFDRFYDATDRWTSTSRMPQLNPTELTLGDIVLVEANLIQFTRQRAGSDSTELIIRPTALSVSRILAAPRPPSIQVGDDFEWSL